MMHRNRNPLLMLTLALTLRAVLVSLDAPSLGAATPGCV